ncbi:calcium/sodium antiporter [Actinoplanes sp. NPDC051513]|uniref:calcium/sodium antiporter n=1 Tax=Actinoplanes sp. NPDC051513 TaxID=3363908 RepID=UPI0037A8A550
MVVDVAGAIAGLVLLTFAADHLVLGASRLARRLRISPVVVGVVVIGLGTSAPEFLVSGLAAARGDTGLAVGNIVGSNILNLTLLLGLAAIIAPIPVASRVIRREVPLAFAAVALFGLLAVVAGLDVLTGVVLAVAGVAALWLLVRWARAGRAEAGLVDEVEEFVARPDEPGRRTWTEAVRAVLGLLGVLAGAQLLVDGASAVAESLGVSQLVIGFTLVALGTSLPELVTSVQAQRRGESDLVVGNLFGSNLFNSLIGGAVIGFADGATAYAGVVLVVTMILSAGLAWLLLMRGLRLTRLDGVVLTVGYAMVAPLLLSA